MPAWSITYQEKTWTGHGNQALLSEPLTAFFSSRQCPGIAIRAAMDWALEQARSRQPVVSGFHSPLEQSVLTVLLQARCPVVAVLARPVAGGRLPPEWADPLAQGRVAVVSAAARGGRLTEERAAQRNEWVATLASQIVVAHASPCLIFEQFGTRLTKENGARRRLGAEGARRGPSRQPSPRGRGSECGDQPAFTFNRHACSSGSV